MTARATKSKAPANGAKANGSKPNGESQTVEQAIAYEEAIRAEADKFWAKDENADVEIDGYRLRNLRPLLRRKIPEAFIQHVGNVSGKPYESTGVKSVQVQIDRLDNVLGPENWGHSYEYDEDGKVCHVRAWIGPEHEPLVVRESHGGMNHGSTRGNLLKGSFTNAAKLAFARLGPGWEVYVGAADFDPDTDPDAAEVQAEARKDRTPEVERIDGERVAALSDLAHDYVDKGADEDEQKTRRRRIGQLLSSEGATGKSISERIASLTPGAADKVQLKIEEWSA